MKVNIEVQSICVPESELRGVPYYTLNIIKELAARKNGFDYSISFFDYNKERNNRQYINKHILLEHPEICTYECNTLNYKDIILSCVNNDFGNFNSGYEEYLGSDANIYHFPHTVYYPYMLTQNTIVVTVHDIIPILFNGRHECFAGHDESAFANTMNYIASHDEITIIADSESTKRDLIEVLKIKEDRIIVTPLGYDKDKHFPEENKAVLKDLGIDSPYLFYLGALDMRKGIFDILKAFNIIKSKYKGLKLVISGKVNEMFKVQYKEKMKDMPLDDVIFTGYVTDEQKRILLSSAEVFLFPSEYEGFGLPVLEAMACGAPVITTNISSLPEVGGDAVLYVSPNRPEELAGQICRFLDSESLRQEYITKGYERAKLFSWDKTAALTEEVYRIAYERTH